jgi:integrase
MYPDGLPFFMIDTNWPQKFDGYLNRKEKLKVNGRFGHHRNVKAILAMAKLQGLILGDVYSVFKVKTESSKWAALSQMELDRIITLYNNGIDDQSERRVVRQFLFGCFTGLRISDQKRFSLDWIHDDIIIFRPKKTINYEVRIPLTSIVKKLIDDEVREVGHHEVFRTITEQYGNRLLKVIAKRLDIKTNIHHHVARETFATRFISAGGDVMVLKELMGHSSISTTSRYVKRNDQLARVATKFIESFSTATIG